MPIHVSATSLKDFVSCSQKTYYKLFDDSVRIQSVEMKMGTITHSILEKYWNNEDLALKMAEEAVRRENLSAQNLQAITHFIHTFFERFALMVTPDDKIEKRFKVKLQEDVYLVGTFDRVSRGMVIDWKTNASPSKRIDNDIQFIIYDYAYNLIYNQNPQGVYMAALKDGSLVRYKENKLMVDTVVERLIPDYVDAVRTKRFVRDGLFNGACYKCPYKQTCLGGKDVVDNSAIAEE